MHSAREGDPPAVLCIGAASINQAVKSVIIARQYLAQDSLDLTFQASLMRNMHSASRCASWPTVLCACPAVGAWSCNNPC